MSRWGCVALGVLAAVAAMLGCMLTTLAVAGGAYYLSRFGQQVEIGESGAMALDVGAPATLTVVNPSGHVTVQVLDVERVQVRVSEVARARTQSWAERLLVQTHVEARAAGPDGVRVEVELPPAFLPGDVEADLLVLTPQPERVEVIAPRGRVRIMGAAADIRVRARRGSVDLQDVAPPTEADVTTDVGDIVFLGRLPEQRGRVLLRTRVGDVRAFLPSDVRCDVDAETRNGQIGSGLALSHVQSGKAGWGGQWLRGRLGADVDVGLLLRTREGDLHIMPLP